MKYKIENNSTVGTVYFANELAEANRLKIIELKLKYDIPNIDLKDWDLYDKA